MNYSITKHNNRLYITQYGKSVGSGMIIDMRELSNSTLLELINFCQEELQTREE